MTIWDSDMRDPRPGASRAVTGTAAVFVAIAWAFALSVRARTSAGFLSFGLLIVGGWIVGLVVICVGPILSLMSLTRVMRDSARDGGGTRVHFWLALGLVVSWPFWMVFILDTALRW